MTKPVAVELCCHATTLIATVVTLLSAQCAYLFQNCSQMLSKIAPQIGALSIFALLFFSAICNLKIMKASVIDFFKNPFTVKSVSGQACFVGVCFTNYTL